MEAFNKAMEYTESLFGVVEAIGNHIGALYTNCRTFLETVLTTLIAFVINTSLVTVVAVLTIILMLVYMMVEACKIPLKWVYYCWR